MSPVYLPSKYQTCQTKTTLMFQVFTTLCLSHCLADSSNSQEVKNKLNSKTINTITVSPKPEIYFQPMQLHHQQLHQQQFHHQQPQTSYYPVQMFPKQNFVPQPQSAMIIIAQPAVVPQQLLYNAAIQQLLSYFHNNPQARYQFLYGYQPHPTIQPYLSQQAPVPSSPIGNYQIVSSPQQFQQLVAATPPSTFNQVHQQYAQPFPYNLNQVPQHQGSSPLRSIPPIIQGLENFTPEQQAHIKSHLGLHLGNSVLSTSSTQETTKQTPSSTSNLNTNEFIPSPQESASNYNSNPSDLYKSSAFVKG